MGKVAVIIPTYDREMILGSCIAHLEKNLLGSELFFYIGNDHPEKNVPMITKNMKVFNSPTGSLGANLNRLIRQADHDGFEYIFQLDDDHILLKPLDLTPHVQALKGNNDIGWIRLMGVAAHKYEASLIEDYWVVKWSSPELYITSNRPHLKTVKFHEINGLYPEGKKLGETEEGFCHQCKDNFATRHQVAIPLTYDDTIWDHVGHSWQMEGH